MTVLKFVVISFFACSLGSSWASQDIVLKTRFDLKSSQLFINQLRHFLINTSLGDPYEREFNKPIVIDLAKVLDEIPEDTQNWIRELQSVMSFNLFQSDYQLVFEKLRYSVQDFNTEFGPGKSANQRVDYVTINYVSGLHLQAEKIIFQVVLKQTQSRAPIKFKVELIEPEFIFNPGLTAELTMGWMTKILPENILLSLDIIDIQKLMESVIRSPELIDLRVKDMNVPDVSFRVGKKEIKFDEKKIKSFFDNRQHEMKKGILDLLSVRLNDQFPNILKDKPQQILLPRRYNLRSDINGVFDIQKMEVNKTGIVQFDLNGHFCDNDVFLLDDFCPGKKIVTKVRRIVDEENFGRSLREVNRKLIEKSSNIALSVSENYLNQLVAATIEAGLWEDNLKDGSFRLGPEKAFILADERGETLSLYLDIIYKLSSTQRILVGRSELRFPVKFGIAVTISDMGEFPQLIIQVKKVLTDHKLLLEGAYDIPSNVSTVPRLRDNVLKAIMKFVRAYSGKKLIELEIKQLKGTYLKQLDFFSDGMGRATATMGFGKEGEP